jgi:hypothetical protein
MTPRVTMRRMRKALIVGTAMSILAGMGEIAEAHVRGGAALRVTGWPLLASLSGDLDYN